MAIGVWEMLGIGITYSGATLGYVLFGYFAFRLHKIRKTTREVLPIIGLMILFLCGATAFLTVSWFDFFRWSGVAVEDVFFLHKIYSMLFFSSMGVIFFLMEYVFKKTKYVLTTYMVVSILTVLFMNTLEGINLITMIFGLPLFALSPIMWYFVFLRDTSGYIRLRMVVAFIGFFLVGSGLVFRNDSLIMALGMWMYVLGTCCGIIGIALVWVGFSALSTFSDLGWKDKLRELFIISHKGISLYAFSFKNNEPLEDTDLIAGGFSGIQSLLSEMVKTDNKIQLIDYRDLKIMLEETHDATFIIILDEESSFINYKLKLFCTEFQDFFRESLDDWVGETNIFQPTKTLIQRIFELD